MSDHEAPLPCGSDPDVLLAQVADGHGGERTVHQAGCPHCQATLAEYTRLWAGIDELTAAEVHAPPGLFDRALATIREQAGPSGYGRVTDGQESFLVAARAVVAVAGHAARSSAGVRVALGALGEPTASSPSSLSTPTAGLSGRSVAVELVVAAEYGHDLHRLAEHVRERVAAEVHAQTGLDVVTVDVAITDVFPRHDTPSPPRAG